MQEVGGHHPHGGEGKVGSSCEVDGGAGGCSRSRLRSGVRGREKIGGEVLRGGVVRCGVGGASA